jgi:hypothetical protein
MVPVEFEPMFPALERRNALERGMCFVMLEETKFQATESNNLVDG